MNGPWSQSIGAFAAGSAALALRLNRCANASLKRSTPTTGAVSGFLGPPSPRPPSDIWVVASSAVCPPSPPASGDSLLPLWELLLQAQKIDRKSTRLNSSHVRISY